MKVFVISDYWEEGKLWFLAKILENPCITCLEGDFVYWGPDVLVALIRTSRSQLVKFLRWVFP